MLHNALNLSKVRRGILYAGVLLIAIVLQNTLLSQIVIFGVRPIILPSVVVAFGFFGGGIVGGIFGLITGVLFDMSLNAGSIIMTVLFTIIGFGSGMTTMFYTNKRLTAFCVVSTLALLLTAFCQMFPYLAFTDTSRVPLLITGGLQTLWSFPFIFLAFYGVRSVSQINVNEDLRI